MRQSCKLIILSVLIISSFTFGCSTGHRIYQSYSPRPLYPEFTDNDNHPLVDSLQPLLKWKDIREEGQTYDLCIWLPEPEGVTLKYNYEISWGKPVYCVRDLSVNYHNVGKALSPDTQYNWSVRLRKGQEALRWGSFSKTDQIITTTRYSRNIPYGFTTPKHAPSGAITLDNNTSSPDTMVADPDTAPGETTIVNPHNNYMPSIFGAY